MVFKTTIVNLQIYKLFAVAAFRKTAEKPVNSLSSSLTFTKPHYDTFPDFAKIAALALSPKTSNNFDLNFHSNLQGVCKNIGSD